MILYGMTQLTSNVEAQWLLENAARRHWALEQLPKQSRGERGKPYFPNNPQWQFNLSHSGTMALCALSEHPVGVDIQMVRPWRERLLDRVCTSEERVWLRSRGDRVEDFAILWAMKESVGKQSGYGLPYPPSKLSVPVPEEGADRMEQPICRRGELWLRVYSGEGWAAAACGLEQPPQAIAWLER